MTATMTWVGLDVHARSTHGTAINALSGELERARFGAGVEGVIEWLGGLEGPVRAVYEAGPTGFGLARAAALGHRGRRLRAGQDAAREGRSGQDRSQGCLEFPGFVDTWHLGRLVGEEGSMGVPAPFPREFREGAVSLVRQGRSVSEVARELGISPRSVRNWVKQDQLDHRERDDGLTSGEREELRELR